MFYIFYQGITPNTASGNRFLAFLKGFDELGVKGTAVLLKPSVNNYKIQETFQFIKIKYLWKDWPFAWRVFDKLYRPLAFQRFLLSLKNGDVVFCYGSSLYLTRFMAKEGVRVFHERTESPDVVSLPTPKLQDGYLRACKSLDGLFVISTTLKSYFVNKGVPADKIRIINMTVDSNRFIGLKKNNSAEKYIAYCGTASNNKDGVDELIKAFSIVAKKHNDVKLYIIGKAPSSNDESGNLKLTKDLGLKERVVFTGVVDSSQMPQLLVNATALALDRPDGLQAQSGFPTKLGEYLLSENPVVVTKVGDIPIFLKDGESALLAEERNAASFASKLCWVLEHPTEAAIIGKNGKKLALKEFNYLIESKKILETIFDHLQINRNINQNAN